MNSQQAGKILNSLVQGADPTTGEDLQGESVLQRAEVLRAMLVAIDALQFSAEREQRRAQLPRRVGQSWTSEEQQQLVAAFQAGESLAVMAKKHERSEHGVKSRLQRLGLLPPDQATPEEP